MIATVVISKMKSSHTRVYSAEWYILNNSSK